MSNDISLLEALVTKKNYERMIPHIRDHTIQRKTKDIIKAMGEYYTSSGLDEVELDLFITWFNVVKHRGAKPATLDVYNLIFMKWSKMRDEGSIETDSLLIEMEYLRLNYANQILNIAMTSIETDTEGGLSLIAALIDEYKEASVSTTLDPSELDDDEVSSDLGELAEEAEEKGLEWRLEELNISCGPLRKGNFVEVAAFVDSGKCLAEGTPIMMYSGEVRPVEEVEDFDLIMGPDGTKRVAMGCIEGIADMYRITHSDGTFYEVNDEHVLSLQYSETSHSPSKVGKILNVSVKDYYAGFVPNKLSLCGYRVGIPGSTQSVPIDPYILGVWLGDGHSNGPMFTNKDEAIWKAISDYSPVTFKSCVNTGEAITCTLATKGSGHTSEFTHLLNSVGLLNNKHIPFVYLSNDRECRLQLLAGLLDTDGSKAGATSYEITQKRKSVSDGIVYLARSLGLKASINIKVVDGTNYYRIYIGGDTSIIPVKLEYKKTMPPTKYKALRWGITVKPIGKGKYYGFTVGKDSLFLLGDFTVTHNTSFLASEISYMAEQLDKGDYVVWINNEERGITVRERIICASLGKTRTEVFKDVEDSSDLYKANFSGDKDRIRLKDTVSATTADLDRFFARVKPKLIVIDMLDKVHGFENNKGNAVDRLEQVYNWAREVAKKYGPVIVTSQVNGEAEDTKWIRMGQLKGSRVAKQGEADLIITIGRKVEEEPGEEHRRYLHIPKNKLSGGDRSDEVLRNGKWEIYIQPTIARYKGIKR